MKDMVAVVGGFDAPKNVEATAQARKPVFHHQFKHHPGGTGLAAPGEVYKISSVSSSSSSSTPTASVANKKNKPPPAPKTVDIYESTFWT